MKTERFLLPELKPRQAGYAPAPRMHRELVGNKAHVSWGEITTAGIAARKGSSLHEA